MNDDNFNKSDRLVACTYADVYCDDYFCKTKAPFDPGLDNVAKYQSRSEWVSPSDLIIDKVELKPPLTSKITRGKTHEGILAIGEAVVEKERQKFLEEVAEIIENNDASWKKILEHESASIKSQVQKIYHDLLTEKNNIMAHEMSTFYEETLQELERYVLTELENMKISTQAHIKSNLNVQIKHNLQKEKVILRKILQDRYVSETNKIKEYYRLILQNELKQCNKCINKALFEKDEALKAFCKEVESDNITSTMYVLCSERKKCKIQHFIMKNIYSSEIDEKHNKIKQRQETLENLKAKDQHLNEINKDWEDKIKKILRLFLKFISFGLKLLPEQTTFLLDFEKMVVLQLNEIQKSPNDAPTCLVETEDLQNAFIFEEADEKNNDCIEEPFVVSGDLTEPPPIRYGSRETLTSNVDLPIIRVQRQFIYAEGSRYSEITNELDAQLCKCRQDLQKIKADEDVENFDLEEKIDVSLVKSESSNELFLVDEINRFNVCPAKKCKDWSKEINFPDLDTFVNFTKENFELVKTILGKSEAGISSLTETINPKEMIMAEMPFSATKEKFHTIATQYSSQESINLSELSCPCIDQVTRRSNKEADLKEFASESLLKILAKRKKSLQRLMQENTNLLKVFTDESFDFQF